MQVLVVYYPLSQKKGEGSEHEALQKQLKHLESLGHDGNLFPAREFDGTLKSSYEELKSMLGSSRYRGICFVGEGTSQLCRDLLQAANALQFRYFESTKTNEVIKRMQRRWYKCVPEVALLASEIRSVSSTNQK